MHNFIFVMMTLGNNKRKRVDLDESDGDGLEEYKEREEEKIMSMFATVKDKENPNEPMAFTCICYEGKFYTTDDMGHFIHKGKTDMTHKLYRCEMDKTNSNVGFVFIRNLDDTELCHFENADGVNVIRDISSNDKSLYY